MIEESSAESIAGRLAEFTLGLDWADVPESAQERASLSVLDALGVGLAAGSFAFSEVARQGIVALAGAGDYPVIGRSERLPLRDAMVLNGTLIHGLDFDDTHSASIVHGSASAVPLMLGVGESVGATGRQALTAFLASMECMARIGRVAKGGFQAGGFHPTGVVGAFGSSLAASKLLALDRPTTVAAQGIALSFASGSLEFLNGGAWTKRIHPGWAAAAGFSAATLAAHGFVGPTAPYAGRYGLYNAYLGPEPARDLGPATYGLGREWEIESVAIKPYPACHFNHAFADAVLALRSGHGLEADDVVSMTAHIHPDQVAVVCEPVEKKRRPTSDYDAKFSVQFVMAAAMVRGRFTLDELEEDALSDLAILELCDRVEYQTDSASRYPQYYSGSVTIETRDGRRLRHDEPVNRGADERPLTAAEVEEKFMSNAGRVMSMEKARTVRDAVLELPGSDSLLPVLRSLSS